MRLDYLSIVTIIISIILQEDFIKWKDSLFFRFIIVYIDEVKEIAEFGKYYIL